MTGWNLPPGCSVADIDRAAGIGVPCEVCGGDPDGDTCVCQECPVCQACGDPACYDVGHKVTSIADLNVTGPSHLLCTLADGLFQLLRTPEQVAQRAKYELELAACAAADEADPFI